MKRAETNFITDLLSNPKLTPDQKNKVFELALRDINKNGPDQRILQDLQIIKEKRGIVPESEIEEGDRKFVKKNGYWTTPVSVEDMKGWDGNVFTNLPVMDEETLKIMTKMGVPKPANEKNGIEPKNATKNLSQNSTIVKNITEEEIEKRLEKVMDPELELKNKQIKKKYHNPEKVLEWLKLFTLGYSSIKFSTHIWDEKDLFPTYNNFIEKVNNEFTDKRFSLLQNYSANLYWEKLYPFLFQQKLTSLEQSGKKAFGWGQHQIKIGWQYPGIIKEWCAENYDEKGIHSQHPFSMEIPDDLKPSVTIHGKTIKTFEDAANLFKKEIEFRDNDLYIGVKIAVKKEVGNFIVDEELLNSLRGCSFYTNTEYILKAVTRILRMIRSRPESQKIQITCHYDESLKEYQLEITHINSFSDKELSHPKIALSEDSGDLIFLRTILQSLCDFSIESRFKDSQGEFTSCRIDYLYKGVDENKWKPKINFINETPQGFKFLLKFPVL